MAQDMKNVEHPYGDYLSWKELFLKWRQALNRAAKITSAFLPGKEA